MINGLIEEGINGILPLATTGESPTISEYEYEKILEKTIECVNKRVPIYTGLGGNNTADVVKKLNFYTTLTLGGDGGIMASASIKPKEFIEIYNLVKDNNHQEALKKWRKLYNMVPLLFAEPNPTPVKYCLKKLGIIDSDEVRLPLVNIRRELEKKLDCFF